MMDISFSNELCYMSASSCNQNQDLFFYSAPTSPSRLKFIDHIGSQTGPTTPRSYEDVNSNLDRFEFETSRRFNHSELIGSKVDRKDAKVFEEHQRLCEDSLPTMAFADELFCDGKVMPMMPPLKLPPRLVQNGDSAQSSRATSPKSPTSKLRLPFSRLWKNDDFDPFKVAFEKVREDKRGKSKGREHGLRRTRSLSPLRDFNKCDKHVGQSESRKHDESHCCEKLPLMSFPEGQMLRELLEEPMHEALGRENIVSEPKGLAFARQVREVKVANDTNFEFEPKKTLVSNAAKEPKKDENKKSGFWTRNKKIESIKKFFFGNSNKGKASDQQKLEDKKEAIGKQTLVKKLDMKSVSSTQSTSWSKDEISGEFTKMRLVCHRPLPKSFLCLGYEGWKVK
ncbi:hypothetical protein KIW84_020597 [Lathyrus oleraceus]|uniref:Uncharacterized protein n=1 Tax=Pisum sativum TaxID=3888 RepID=A0A9D4YB32_PEA|nr:hypothetical protein KIW84_020597 [Pisum sativum]